MSRKRKKPVFTIAVMRGVVEHYRALRVQPICPDCRYILYADIPDVSVAPDGFEPMREHEMFISQCPKHNRPLHQWLHAVDTDKAARWLVKKGNKAPDGLLVPSAELLEEWKAAVYTPPKEQLN